MVMTRVASQTHNNLTEAMTGIATDLNELKTGVQLVEASLYNQTTGSTYDMSGWADASGTYINYTTTNTTFLQIVVTVTSSDGTPLMAQLTPVLWLDSQSSQYVDTTTSYCVVAFGKQVSSGPTVNKFWVNVSTRGTQTVSQWWFKAYCYTSSPATLSFARTI